MPLPADYLPRKGDLLTLRAKVEYDVDPGEEVHLKIIGCNHASVMIPMDDIVDLYCRAWVPGDKVQDTDTKQKGEVIAVYEDRAWVNYGYGTVETMQANDLEPQPPEPEVIEPPASPKPQGDAA